MECNSISRANFMPVQHCRTSELLRPLSNTKKQWSKEKFNSNYRQPLQPCLEPLLELVHSLSGSKCQKYNSLKLTFKFKSNPVKLGILLSTTSASFALWPRIHSISQFWAKSDWSNTVFCSICHRNSCENLSYNCFQIKAQKTHFELRICDFYFIHLFILKTK